MYKLPSTPVKRKPYPARATIEQPSTPTQSTKTYTQYKSLAHFFMEMDIVVQK